MENILRNALRYTPSGTAVDVSVVSDEKGIALRIRDHGPGAPEEELEKIFLPFYRTESARTRDTGGTGIGLAIALRAARDGANVADRTGQRRSASPSTSPAGSCPQFRSVTSSSLW